MATPPPETILLPHGPTPIVWRRSTRARRVNLRIDARTAAIVITLPPRAAHAAGLRLLTEHAGWVSGKLAAMPPPLEFADGSTVPVADIPHRIRHRPGGTTGLANREIHVCGDPAFLPRRVADLLRAEARRQLGAHVADVAAATGLHPARVAVRDPRSRWGSCSARRTVMFNWRLVMAPPAVQHYVVVHELAHLRHMNHGPAFWALVTAEAPDRAACVAWLRTYGPALMRAGPVARS